MISDFQHNKLPPELGNLFFEYAADPIFITDTQSRRFATVNLAACEHLGYSREELLQMGPADINAPGDFPNLDTKLLRLKQENIAKFEINHVHRSGRQIPVEINSRLLELDGNSYILSVCRNISARKKAEWLERQHTAAINTSHDGFWIVDAQGTILEANEAYARMSGYSTQELRGMHISQLDSQEESLEEINQHIEKIIAQGHDLFETRHRRKDGSEIHIEVSTSYIPESAQFVAFCRDITERKLQFLQLQKREHHLRQSQSISQTGSWIYDMKGQITWSDEMHRIFGVSPDTFSLNPATFIDLIHPDDQLSMHAWIAACASSENPGPLEFRGVRPSGEIRHVRSLCELMHDPDGKPVLIAGTSQDITDLNIISNKLKESEERLALATRAGGIGIWDWDIAHDKLIWDDAMFRLYGIAPEDFSSAYDSWKKAVHPDDIKVAEQNLQGALNGENDFEHDFRVIHADGSIHYLRSNARLFHDAMGKPVRMVGLNWDVSAQKLQEIQLRDSMLQMERNEKAKTRFLAAASHDLRQPITAAKLFVHALKLTSTNKTQSDLIGQLNNSMTTFSDLLERLLDISKFDAGLIKPQLTTFNLAKIFRWLQQNFAQAAFDKSLDLRFYFPVSKSLTVHTDINLLKSVLMNLLSNALKFTNRGGILVSARLRGDKVLLQIWDTGIGISEENLTHIFDEFFQVANPHRSRDDGLGLGLSICRRAVSLLNGEINCHSKPGHGTVFELMLPLAADKIITPPPAPAETKYTYDLASMVRGKSVAVIEDDKLVAAGLTSLLQTMGAELLHFYNAEDALKHGKIRDADYYIVDYALEGEINGLQFLNTLQQQLGKTPNAVIITGETSTQFIKQMSETPWPMLHKPIDMNKLAHALSRYAEIAETS